jgi:hypothetical protein
MELDDGDEFSCRQSRCSKTVAANATAPQARPAVKHGKAQPVLPVQEKPPAFSFCRFAGAYRWSASFAPSPR